MDICQCDMWQYLYCDRLFYMVNWLKRKRKKVIVILWRNLLWVITIFKCRPYNNHMYHVWDMSEQCVCVCKESNKSILKPIFELNRIFYLIHTNAFRNQTRSHLYYANCMHLHSDYFVIYYNFMSWTLASFWFKPYWLIPYLSRRAQRALTMSAYRRRRNESFTSRFLSGSGRKLRRFTVIEP